MGKNKEISRIVKYTPKHHKHIVCFSKTNNQVNFYLYKSFSSFFPSKLKKLNISAIYYCNRPIFFSESFYLSTNNNPTTRITTRTSSRWSLTKNKKLKKPFFNQSSYFFQWIFLWYLSTSFSGEHREHLLGILYYLIW